MTSEVSGTRPEDPGDTQAPGRAPVTPDSAAAPEVGPGQDVSFHDGSTGGGAEGADARSVPDEDVREPGSAGQAGAAASVEPPD